MLDVSDFIGHFHPVLVHLPIGVLLIAVLFQILAWRDRSERNPFTKPLLIAVSFGATGAVFSCITGYLLSLSADYEEGTVWWHQWLGILVASASLIWLLILTKSAGQSWSQKYPTILAVAVLVLIVITGHLGGSLTHGEDYLSFNAGPDSAKAAQRKPIENVQQAVAYTEIVKPILSSSCYSCHGETKQKGKLRMDLPELMMKGGKNGETIKPSHASESEMIQRLLLPLDHKKHMPPKEKQQLTRDEIALLHWWIETGASYDKKVADLKQDAKIKPVLSALSKTPVNSHTEADIPDQPVEEPDPKVLAALRKKGVVVLPVSTTSNYITANFISVPTANDEDIKLLSPLSKQLVQLKVGDTKITDAALSTIAQCTNLRKLQLQHTAITDKGLQALLPLKKLQELNLVGTAVTARGIIQLKQLTTLKDIYLYQTGVVRAGWQELAQAFPAARLDSGGYIVPVLKTDTSIVQATPKKN